MTIKIISLTKEYLPAACRLWNEIVLEGDSFPQENVLTEEEAWTFFQSQTETFLLLADNTPAGLYILHPNNVGRCAHTANTSYAVTKQYRGMGLGKQLVGHSLHKAKEYGFLGLQFNAVVSNNHAAIRLYLGLGFTIIGTIPKGFRLKNGLLQDTLILYKTL